eukprot:4447532-Lingulodinium_polyedra.AAC.1
MAKGERPIVNAAARLLLTLHCHITEACKRCRGDRRMNTATTGNLTVLNPSKRPTRQCIVARRACASICPNTALHITSAHAYTMTVDMETWRHGDMGQDATTT